MEEKGRRRGWEGSVREDEDGKDRGEQERRGWKEKENKRGDKERWKTRDGGENGKVQDLRIRKKKKKRER